MWWNIIIALASYALQLALTPKPQNAKAKSLEDFQAPTAEEGREIPVCFGTNDFADPNVTWYGDLQKSAIKGARRYGLFGPRQVLGYKYSLGMQMGLCHGPADAIHGIRVGDKVAFKGTNAGGRITINKNQLFGGDQSEGGISGDVDICMGAPGQLQNDYLVSKLGAHISAFRGVVTAVLRRVYLGTSNYIKPWEFRVQRIYLRSDGTEQWYSAKAGIAAESTTDGLALYFAIDTSFEEFGLFYTRVTLHGAIDKLRTDGTSCDIHMVSFSTTVKDTIERRNCDAGDLDDIDAWIDALTADHLLADYNVGVSQAAGFFKDADVKKKRVILLMSDDEAAPGTPEAAKATIAAIEDDIYVHGFLFGRFRLDSPNLNIVDNTPGDQQGGPGGWCPWFLSTPLALYSALSVVTVTAIDMNPAHIIRECLTDRVWGLGYNDADIDDDSFTSCADTFYGESFGLSLKWYREEEIKEFVSTILSHVDANLYGSRATGKFFLKAIRNDYDIDTIPVLTEDDVLEWTEVSHRQPSEASSSVLLKYYNREKRKNGSHLVTNTAQAMQATKVLPTTREYPGINKSSLAIRVATRDVIALGSGLISGRLVGNRKVESLNPGDPFRLVSARHKLSGQVMRLVDPTFGDGRSNKIGMKFFQDVFKLGASVLVDDTNSGGWVPPSNIPLPVSPRLVQEMPYRELRQMVGDADAATMLTSDADAGLIQVAGSSPTPDASNAEMQVDAGTGYVGTDVLDFAPGAFLDGAVAAVATEISVTGAVELGDAALGTLAAIVGATPQTTEIVRIDEIDGNTLTITRGCLDTVPQAHSDGASIVLFDDISNSDFEVYTAGTEIAVKLLTITGRGGLDLASAPADTVTMASRAIRPLRPANVEVDGTGFGVVAGDGVSDLVASWAERNRLTEMTPLAWTDATVTPEAGQRTIIEVLDPAEAVLTTHAGLSGTSFPVPVASFAGNSSGWLRFGSERDGYREWQAYQLAVVFTRLEAGIFTLTGQAADLLFGTIMPAATGFFTLTGNPVAMNVDGPAQTGAFVITGNPAGLQYSAGGVDTAVFTITGNPATLTFALGETDAALPMMMVNSTGTRQSMLPGIFVDES
ncbi:MAG: hypothetical protein EOR97_17235 [Mesorhizobium sp.]|uniref:hypothetical protein n=1 Tax=Mesorhizobium sp. TaxID=1871066 RepID=UPI000FE6F105|nr:hypothetical protein [Mesorhizobium sp.]RWN30116.1 MAG: hypothetical protein EOR97_17235 [Mesorhizobium sp.]